MARFPLHPLHHWRRWLAALLGLAALYTLCGFFLAPVAIRHAATRGVSDLLGRNATVETVAFNPYTLACEIKGLRVFSGSRRDPLISLDRLYFNLEAASLFKQALILKRLEIDSPFVAIIRNADRSYNLPDLQARPEKPKRSAKEEGFRFSLNNIVVTGGRVEVRDRAAGARHSITGLQLQIPFLSNLPYALDEYVDLLVEARVNDMSVRMDGRAKPFADSRKTRVDLSFRDLDLTNYLQYLPGPRNFTLTRGCLSSDLTLAYGQPAQGRPYLRLEGGLEAEDLLCTEPEGGPRFFRVPAASLEMGPGNLLAGEVRLASVALQHPRIWMTQRTDGSLRLPSLGAAERSAPPGNAQAATGFPAVGVDRFRIVSGGVRWTDRSTTPIFNATLEPVDLEMTGFRPSSRETTDFDLRAGTSAGERIEANGTVGLHPLRIRGSVRLAGLAVDRYAPYYRPFFQGSVAGGRCDLGLDLRLDIQEEVLRFERVNASLRGLSLEAAQGGRVLDLDELAVREAAVDVTQRSAVVGRIRARGGNATIVRGADGAVNIASLLPERVPEPDIPVPVPNRGMWQMTLERVDLNGLQAEFTDRSVPSPARLRVALAGLAAQGLSTRSGSPGSLNATLRIGSGAKLRLDGEVGLSPPSGRLRLSLSDLDLQTMQPYLETLVDLDVQGLLDAQGDVRIRGDASGSPDAAYGGSAQIVDFATSVPESDTNLLSWGRLGIEGITAGTGPARFSAESVELGDAHIHLRIREDGSTNLPRLLGRTERTEPRRTGAPDAAPVYLAVGETTLSRGSFSFRDLRLSPGFRMSVSQIEGLIGRLATNRKEGAPVSLKGLVAGQGPVRVNGTVEPLAEPPSADLELRLSNVGLPPFSPYAGRYIGYTVKRGKLYLDTQAAIRGRTLTSDNRIVLDRFELGSRVRSPVAVNAPVKLGLALLKNREGKIRITKEVGGDLSDPAFTVGDIVMRVFVNVVAKAATSPFAFLGAVFGGGQDVSRIEFEPGEASLRPKARKKARTIAEAMYERPALKIELLGMADADADRSALREARFRRLLREQKRQDLEESGEPAPPLGDIRIAPGEYERYLWRAYKAAPMEKPETFLGRPKKIPAREQEKRLRAHIEVTRADLHELARQRAETVRGIILGAAPVESDRIFVLNPEVVSDEEAAAGVELRMH